MISTDRKARGRKQNDRLSPIESAHLILRMLAGKEIPTDQFGRVEWCWGECEQYIRECPDTGFDQWLAWAGKRFPNRINEIRQAIDVARANPQVDPEPQADKKGVDASVDAQFTFRLTDLGNAERFVDQHGADLRYCHRWSKWVAWDGRRWAADATGEPKRRARKTVRSMYAEAAQMENDQARNQLVTHAQSCEKAGRLAAMLSLAEAEPGIPIVPDQMIGDLWAFNCLNGTIDLRTGKLRPHSRADLITALCRVEYNPNAQCPRWLQTLELFFAGNKELIAYFQRVAGYSMTGVIRDHVLPVAYGRGSNGKSTMLGTLLDVFGPDYAMKAPPDLLMAKKNDGHPTDRASLFGKRLVVAIESEDGRRLNETMVKELTGGDRISARRMREDYWEFDPTHTLIMATNHKPVIRGTDNGIWRRLRLIPFSVQVADKDANKQMPTLLKEEYAGILAWCVRGCLDWQEKGLGEPQEIVEATDGYRKEQDRLGVFLEEHAIIHESLQVKASKLYERYKFIAERDKEFVMSQKAFGEAIEERGIKKKKSNGVWYQGLGLRDLSEEGEEGGNE